MLYTPPMAEEAASGFRRLSRTWELPLSFEAVERLGIYVERLLEWNERVNLTGARGVPELIGEHLPDSYALAKMCPPEASLVDVGSGGGLPAIPFAILRPDCRITLVEPRAKRTAFLNTAVRSCGLRQVEVLRSRVEDLPESEHTVAASRATFNPSTWLQLAPRLLGPEGLVFVFSTSRDIETSARARLVESVDYRTSEGSPRWLGSYRFT